MAMFIQTRPIINMPRPPLIFMNAEQFILHTKDGQLVSAATQASGFKIAINPEKIANITNGEISFKHWQK